MKKLSLLLALKALLITGCVSSVDDFQSMHPYNRANKVCHNSDAYQYRQDALKNAKKRWAYHNNLAQKGYRIVKTCHTVTSPTYSKQCTENIVGVDVDKTEQRAEEARQQVQNIKKNDRRMTGECIARVLKLTPEEAYRLYKADID